MGEGGAGRAGLVVLGFCLVGVVLFAVVDRDRTNRLAPAGAVATTPTVPAGEEPCGGAASVEAAVRASSVGGLSSSSSRFDVNQVRVAQSDPNWGRFSVVAKAGQEAAFQPGHGVVQCTLIGWQVNDIGTSGVGCSGANAAPAAVRSELGLSCPS